MCAEVMSRKGHGPFYKQKVLGLGGKEKCKMRLERERLPGSLVGHGGECSLD